MYKFNNSDVVTGYIKELLKSFNLPQLHVLKSGDTLFPENDYLHINKIYKFKGSDKTVLNDLSNLPTTLKHVDNYVYGQRILNLTKNLNIHGPLYTKYVHEYLGNYLRFHRDYLGINLMSMYNCFSNYMPETLKINTDIIYFDSKDTSSKIYVIPAKFFQKYTVGIDCDTSIEMFAGFYDEGEIIFDNDYITNEFYNNTYVKKTGSKFKKPFIYDKLENISGLMLSQYNLESKLVIYLKIPFSCKSSITILEGDYVSGTEHYFIDGAERLSNIPLFYKHDGQEITNYTYITKPQLLYFNSEISYPFADRLIEYLFKNVVDNSEEIGENIQRVQDILLKTTAGEKLVSNIKYGEWNDVIRQVIYENEISLGLIHKAFDSIGFYDKDIEELLGE